MKCLVINGSPSRSYMWNNVVTQSFTGKLLKEIQDNMLQFGDIDFEEVHLGDSNLPYCRGCYTCFNKGENKCPHARIIQPVIEKLKEADCLIITSPVYALNVSGLIKNFFDLTAYNYHRPYFFDKKALVICSTAGGAAKSTCRYMRDTLKHWGFNKVYSFPVVRMGAVDINNKLKKKCQNIALHFYTDVASGKLHSPSFKRVFFYQIWRNLLKNDPNSADYKYWQESGLVNHVFSPKVKTGFVKKTFGNIINGLISKIAK